MNFVRQWFVLIVLALLWACSTDDNSELNSIDMYLMNRNIDSAQIAESGVYYVIYDQLNTMHPSDSHTIKLEYTLRLTNGEVIEQRTSNDPLFRNMRFLMPSLRNGLGFFGTDESGTLIIPSDLITITDSSGPVPPNADLVFNIQRLEVFPFAEEFVLLEGNSVTDTSIVSDSVTLFAVTMDTVSMDSVTIDSMRIDTVIIDTLITQLTNFETTTNGIFYLITEDSVEREQPTLTNTVAINYQAYYTNGDQFDSSDSLVVDLMDASIIEGWRTSIPILEIGEKGTFVIPYQLAFGSEGDRVLNVPEYTDVVYDIQLLTIQ